ncbi:hypothetical protein ID867_17875 [Streptomyces parvulus]|nr:hypothetical protein [Streptomyces parvulus]
MPCASGSSSPPTSTSSSTGVRVRTCRPPASVTRRTSPSISTVGGTARLPRTAGRVRRGSAVISTSAVTVAYCRASAGTGPRRRSAPCSAAEAAEAETQSRRAATEARARPRAAPRARTGSSRRTAATRPTVTAPTAHPGGALSSSAAVAQAASAGGTSRRSAGPSCRGWAAPSRCPEAACTAARGGVVPSAGTRRPPGLRCRSRR